MPQKTLPPAVLDALRGAEVGDTTVRLVGQLDRPTYTAVNAALVNAGGKWNRKAQAHVFPDDPRAAVDAMLGTGRAPLHARAAEGYVATPDPLADTICWAPYVDLDALPLGARVLEPSAGDGALVRAIRRANSGVWIDAVEPNPGRAQAIMSEKDPADLTGVYQFTFEEFAAVPRPPGERDLYDAVVMNPPFALPGQPTVWIDHVSLAWSLLKPGGRLVAIAPAGYTFRRDRRHNEMRAEVEAHGWAKELPADAFTASGTGIRAVVLVMTKP